MALSTAIDAALACDGDRSLPPPLFVFDFDRTLTNGMSKPGEEVELSKVVRGGEDTVRALQRAKDAGAGLYIITARAPRALTVEQLYASLDNAQSALSPIFRRGTEAPEEFTVKDADGNDIPLARGGNIFAADYQKAAALAQIIREQGQDSLRAFFFDDAIVNAHVVATATKLHLSSSSEIPDVALTSYWWDTYEEETGPNRSMTPSHTATTDSNYADFARHMLSDFGVTKEEVRVLLRVSLLPTSKL